MITETKNRSENFKFYFNKRKQWSIVYLHDVHPTTFASWKSGYWAYFQASYDNPRSGMFGELHFVKSRLRYDVVNHELFHLLTEWVWSGGDTITRRNEEKYASFFDEITRRFIRELRKFDRRIVL